MKIIKNEKQWQRCGDLYLASIQLSIAQRLSVPTLQHA